MRAADRNFAGMFVAGEPLGKCMREAASHIEELEDKLDWVIVERDETFALMLQRVQTAEAKLAKAVGALRTLTSEVSDSGTWLGRTDAFEIARATLAEQE